MVHLCTDRHMNCVHCVFDAAVNINPPTSIPIVLAVVQEEESVAANEVEKTAAPLQETRLKLIAALVKIRDKDDEASDALNAAYLTASKEAKRLLREGAPAADYAKKAVEVNSLEAKLDSERAADAAFWKEVVKLESALATQRAAHDVAVAALTRAQAKVAEARQQSLTLSTPSTFVYPKDKSLPPLGLEVNDMCAYCGLGFVWKAAVLSSCGCFLHPRCVAELLAVQEYRCKRCTDPHLPLSPIHLQAPWVAQFGGQMEPHQDIEVSAFSKVLEFDREGGGADGDDNTMDSATR